MNFRRGELGVEIEDQRLRGPVPACDEMERAEEGGEEAAGGGPGVRVDEGADGEELEEFVGEVRGEEVAVAPFFEEADGGGEDGEAGTQGGNGLRVGGTVDEVSFVGCDREGDFFFGGGAGDAAV